MNATPGQLAESQANYAAKTGIYFGWARPEMLAFVPANCKRVLDVGCGNGLFGESLKETRNSEVWGVELVHSAAVNAKARLDHVIEAEFSPALRLPPHSFDCVIFNDVLEHMLAPEAALSYARELLAPDGVVVASIPNIRSLPTFWQILFHARWEYEDAGVLDKTHLRFFTKSSILNMFAREKFKVGSICGISPYSGTPDISNWVWRGYKLADALSFGRLSDMKFLQFAVVAKACEDT